MLKEAFNWIKNHGEKQVQIIEDGQKRFSSQSLNPIVEPHCEPMDLSTLLGLCQFVNNKVDNFDKSKVLIQVCDHDKVRLHGPLTGVWRQREKIAVVGYPQIDGFDFGSKMDHEDFVIALQTHFEETEDLKKIISLVGTMKAGKVQTNSDDGISQTVETSMGVTLASEKVVPNPVLLRPFRTFRDLESQPESKFVFRVHQRDDEMPRCALYEADGGAWVIDAVDKIHGYLKKQLSDVEIIS